MKTFVFTDIVRSVELKGQMNGASDTERDEAFVATILTPHRQRIERELEGRGGRVVSTAGDGHFLVFDNTISAATWAVGVQKTHCDEPVTTPTGDRVEVRMSLHVGFPQPDPNDPDNFIGRVVDYAARLNDFASRGQILISTAALGLLKDAGLDGVSFHLHGERDLRGIGSVDVHELLYDSEEPRPTRDKPSGLSDREWTVLPATMGLTDYAQKGSSVGTGVTTPPPPAKRLGNYELKELLGSGGMGAVYKARHTQFERDRAVKVIKPHLIQHLGDGHSGHEEIVRRFYREIKAMGALDHPNIVVAIDSSAPDDETHYLVMEYVDGLGAEELVNRRGPMPVAAACEIARQVAVGLDYIHRQGMVHRDIKPSNLMLTQVDSAGLPGAGGDSDQSTEDFEQTPVVKILDLGLALLVTDDQPRLTQLGHGAMGTAMYMSPEQWSTTSVDIRSDIYSLGCTLYHLLSGRPPFYDSDLRPQRAHEKSPIPSEFGRDDVPKALRKVLRKMMAKSPANRYTRPAEVAEDLAAFADPAELNRVVNGWRVESGATTRRPVATDTLAGAASGIDTLGPVPPTPMHGSWQAQPTRPLWRRLVTPLIALAAIAAAFWMASQAGQWRQSLREAERQNLVVAAGQAAPRLADEIDKRFDILTRASREKTLLDAIAAVDIGDRSTWSAAQAWIEKSRQEGDRRVASGSWFIADRSGIQIARADRSGSIGKSFAWRDYFHGKGYDLREGDSAEPIQKPVQSAVYRSKTSGVLKVAFSVPIWNATETAQEREVLGVLGMSVALGEFRLLKDSGRFPEPLEVVLVDLRRDDLGAGRATQEKPLRGLLLHHPELARLEVVSDPFRLPAPLLSQVNEALKRRKQSGSLSDPIIEGYSDLLNRPGRGAYIGAFEPVVVDNPEGKRDTEWLIIVQRELNP